MTLIHTAVTKIQAIFEAQQKNQYEIALSTAKERIRKLNKLHDAIMGNQAEIREAMWQDYRKPAAEVDLTEIYVITSEIKHAKSHLKRWMSAQKVPTPMAFIGASSWIKHEP